MRVMVVRTPGELRDEIGHKIMVQKDWLGSVVEELDDETVAAAGFHPKRSEKVYRVLFDDWGQHIAVPAANLVEIADDEQQLNSAEKAQED